MKSAGLDCSCFLSLLDFRNTNAADGGGEAAASAEGQIMPQLSQEQVALYREDGLIFLPSLFAAPEVQVLKPRYQMRGMARRELWRRRLGADAVRDAWRAQRCPVDLLPRPYPRERLRGPVVRWVQGRDGGGRVQGAGR